MRTRKPLKSNLDSRCKLRILDSSKILKRIQDSGMEGCTPKILFWNGLIINEMFWTQPIKSINQKRSSKTINFMNTQHC